MENLHVNLQYRSVCLIVLVNRPLAVQTGSHAPHNTHTHTLNCGSETEISKNKSSLNAQMSLFFLSSSPHKFVKRVSALRTTNVFIKIETAPVRHHRPEHPKKTSSYPAKESMWENCVHVGTKIIVQTKATRSSIYFAGFDHFTKVGIPEQNE